MELNDVAELYNADEIKQMQVADASRMPGKDRVQEIVSFARQMGYKKIGIAHCVAVQREAEQLREMLTSDFEVVLVGCKHNKIPSSVFIGNEAKGLSCNPAGQAQFLAENNTDLNLVMGLCVGHDMIFSAKSHAPSTTLLVKDRANSNNPSAIFSSKE